MSEIYTDPPQSRNEAIIKATIDGTEYTAPPQSRMEDLLLELKEVIEQGGGGGTSDYTQLSNKPSINDVTLSGNKSASDLGLMPEYEVDTTPTESSENLITSGAVWSADKNIENKLQGSKTATGNPITITDAEPMNAESVVVELEPTQDLHGYSKPWAGGAGKNKLPLTVDGIKASNTDGTWSGNTYSVNGATYTIETDIDGNVTSINGVGNGSSGSNLYLYFTLQAGSYSMISGFSENQGSNDTLLLNSSSTVIARGNSGAPGQDFTLNEASNVTWVFRVTGAYTSAFICTPMIRLATETDPTFAPYSNICPITGYSEVNVEVSGDNVWTGGDLLNFTQAYIANKTITPGTYVVSSYVTSTDTDAETSRVLFKYFDDVSGDNSPTIYFNRNQLEQHEIVLTKEVDEIYFYASTDFAKSADDVVSFADLKICKDASHVTIDLDGTKYGGTLDVTEGGYSDEWGYIASYNGETLPSTWISSMDEYAEGTTPTTGAEVVYTLATPLTIQLTPTQIQLLENTNNISTDGTNIQLKYQPNNVIGECKKFTVDEIAKLGLPQPPTTDGTYHLECSVSSGIPTIRWVSNS